MSGRISEADLAMIIRDDDEQNCPLVDSALAELKASRALFAELRALVSSTDRLCKALHHCGFIAPFDLKPFVSEVEAQLRELKIESLLASHTEAKQ